MNHKNLILFLIIFFIYLFTIHPSVSPYRDSGDLIVSASTLGVAHPPGYPLYTLLGKIFIHIIPWGNAAYKINLMSAVFGALAVFLTGMVALRIFGSSFILIPLMFLSFSPAFWRLSQVSEMYSFNAFFAALIMLMVLKIVERAKNKQVDNNLLLATSLACGFATGNHQTIIFIYPALAWLLFKYKYVNYNNLVKSAIYFVFGLSVYGFLMIRSHTEPLLDWGNPENLKSLFRLMTRADYGGMRLHPEQSKFSWTIPLIFQHLLVYVKSLIDQFTIPGVILGFIGIAKKYKDDYFKFVLFGLLISGPGFIILSNLPPELNTTLPILEPHLVLPNLMFGLFIVAGAYALLKSNVLKALSVLLVLFSFIEHIGECNYRNHFYAYDYGRNLFMTVKKQGLIYDPDDATAFISSYLQEIEKKRNDIRVITFFRTRWGYELLKKKYPELLPKKEIKSGRELARVLIDNNVRKYSIYADLYSKLPQNYSSIPEGVLYKINTEKRKTDNRIFKLYFMRGKFKTDKKYDFFTNRIISYYSAAQNNLGLSFASQKQYNQAFDAYNKALAIEYDLLAAHNNIGSLSYFLGNYGEAEQKFKKVLEVEPDNPEAQFNMGLAHKSQKKWKLAEEYFRKSWERGNYPKAGNELGLLALNFGQNASAIAIYQEVINKYPNFYLAYYNLGLALKNEGRFQDSIKSFQIYLKFVKDPRERAEVTKMLDTLQNR